MPNELILQRLDNHEERISDLERADRQIVQDISALKARLEETATKADIAGVSAKIDTAVSGLLRDALSAVPSRHLNTLTAISIAVMVVGVALGWLHR